MTQARGRGSLQPGSPPETGGQGSVPPPWLSSPRSLQVEDRCKRPLNHQAEARKAMCYLTVPLDTGLSNMAQASQPWRQAPSQRQAAAGIILPPSTGFNPSTHVSGQAPGTMPPLGGSSCLRVTANVVQPNLSWEAWLLSALACDVNKARKRQNTGLFSVTPMIPKSPLSLGGTGGPRPIRDNTYDQGKTGPRMPYHLLADSGCAHIVLPRLP